MTPTFERSKNDYRRPGSVYDTRTYSVHVERGRWAGTIFVRTHTVEGWTRRWFSICDDYDYDKFYPYDAGKPEFRRKVWRAFDKWIKEQP